MLRSGHQCVPDQASRLGLPVELLDVLLEEARSLKLADLRSAGAGDSRFETMSMNRETRQAIAAA